MSKVQGKDADLLNNLTGTGIASELDSRLRELEKNIAVAREFIKLADESYSELRHQWNLIQEEARNKTGAGISERATSSSKKSSHRSQTDESTRTGDVVVSKTAELAGEAVARSPKSEKSKSRNKHGKIWKQSKDSEEVPDFSGQIESVTPPNDRGSKRRKDRARSSAI